VSDVLCSYFKIVVEEINMSLHESPKCCFYWLVSTYQIIAGSSFCQRRSIYPVVLKDKPQDAIYQHHGASMEKPWNMSSGHCGAPWIHMAMKWDDQTTSVT
jgi:hypothetical protein